MPNDLVSAYKWINIAAVADSPEAILAFQA
jgi:hypothetical protein